MFDIVDRDPNACGVCGRPRAANREHECLNTDGSSVYFREKYGASREPKTAAQAIRELRADPLADTSPWALQPTPRYSAQDAIRDVLAELGDDALTIEYRRLPIAEDEGPQVYPNGMTRCSQCRKPSASPVAGRCHDCHDRYQRNLVTDPIGTLRHYDGTVVQCAGCPKRDPAPHGGRRWWRTVVHNPHHPLTVANEDIAKWPVIYGGFDD